MTKNQLAQMIDHTLLKPNATLTDLRTHCLIAAEHGFKSVAINSAVVAFCHQVLERSGVLCDATIGFPFGQCSIASKLFETRDAIGSGAGEIDYVVNLVELKSSHWDFVEDEMRQIVELCREHSVGSKVIIETCYLTAAEKEHICEIAAKVKPTFVKTSTGFGSPVQGVPTGATLEDIQLMSRCVEGSGVLVKASGGIRTTRQALAMLEAGASRIGTSNGVGILEGFVE